MKQRYHLLDAMRGAAVVMMLAYHAAWDIIYIFGVSSNLLRTPFAGVWQTVGSWLFIGLSGFCWSMGKHPLKHGAACFGFGALMTIITLAIMPQNRVVFGVLTLLGSCMLLMIPLDALFRRWHIPAQLGAVVSFVLFLFVKNMRDGTLGFWGWQPIVLPDWLYRGYFTAYLGFPQTGFYSTDYYPLFPWLLLFCTGYFIYHAAQQHCAKEGAFWRTLQTKIPPLGWLGRHSLVIYLFHQPVIYGVLYLLFVGL